jgi:DNA (cytosine-5)-methyltransferase 1
MVDLFSGGGAGWCLGARELGLPSVGIEWDGPACKTRAVVGLPTIRADVSTYPAEVFAGKVEGICGGPPCQSFSSAGKGKGLNDPRGQMVYEPMRYVRAIRPRWVALEQVPEVLGYWRWIAMELRTMGYSAWAGVLQCADYGVPQCRRRAILLASLDRQAEPPAPTHSKHGQPGMFGEHLPRWISMAEGLGWGITDRPAYTVCGGNRDGGRTQGDGGSGQRRMYRQAQEEGRWMLRSPGRSYAAKPRVADPTTEPAPTIALGHNASSWCWERPATTIAADARVFGPHSGGNGDHHSENAIPVEPWELGVLQGFPADHPWQPPRVSAQIGNAVPVPLALACLESITGRKRV